MLIITRHPNESITIGNDTVLKVLGIQNGQVRLGIEAPKKVDVWRTELLEGAADSLAVDK